VRARALGREREPHSQAATELGGALLVSWGDVQHFYGYTAQV